MDRITTEVMLTWFSILSTILESQHLRDHKAVQWFRKAYINILKANGCQKVDSNSYSKSLEGMWFFYKASNLTSIYFFDPENDPNFLKL